MKPVRAAKADTGEIAAAAGCKPAPVGNNGPRALRQIPPFPCAVKGAEMHKKWAISGTRFFSSSKFNDNFFKGTTDELRLHYSSLSDSEIQDIYNAQKTS